MGSMVYSLLWVIQDLYHPPSVGVWAHSPLWPSWGGATDSALELRGLGFSGFRPKIAS